MTRFCPSADAEVLFDVYAVVFRDDVRRQRDEGGQLAHAFLAHCADAAVDDAVPRHVVVEFNCPFILADLRRGFLRRFCHEFVKQSARFRLAKQLYHVADVALCWQFRADILDMQDADTPRNAEQLLCHLLRVLLARVHRCPG